MSTPLPQESAPQRGRPCALDSDKRRRIVALLDIGCSRRAAARCVGCAPSTIARTAQQIPEFRDEVARAESNLEVDLLKSVRNAAKNERYWHAAAWLLERKFAPDYIPNPPQLFTIEQIGQLFTAILESLREQIPQAQRDQIVKQLDTLMAEFSTTS